MDPMRNGLDRIILQRNALSMGLSEHSWYHVGLGSVLVFDISATVKTVTNPAGKPPVPDVAPKFRGS